MSIISIHKFAACTFLILSVLGGILTKAGAGLDPFDPRANITVVWNVVNRTSRNFTVLVSIHNYQQYRHIQSPGWTLEWTWRHDYDVLWGLKGAQVADKGDCSEFNGGDREVPISCARRPMIRDLNPQAPQYQKFPNCCKGGMHDPGVSGPSNGTTTSFQFVGGARSRNGTLMRALEINLVTLTAPGGHYICRSIRLPVMGVVKRGQRRPIRDLKTVCGYRQPLVEKVPSCCTSFSSFNNRTFLPCPTCSCGCKNTSTYINGSMRLRSAWAVPGMPYNDHTCPANVHWHLMENNKNYWHVKLALTNFDHKSNEFRWTLIVQHPDFNNATQITGSNYYKFLTRATPNDTIFFWGVDPSNHVAEIDLRIPKSGGAHTFEAPKIYLNDKSCEMPPPDATLFLLNSSIVQKMSRLVLLFSFLVLSVTYLSQ